MLADQAASVLIRHQPGLTERQATLAEAWFRRAISLLEPRHSTDPALSDQYNGMGMAIHHSPVHGRIGRWKEARDCYARALEIDRRRESRGGQAICLLNLAAILGEAADNTPDLRLEAVRCLEEAEQIQRDRQNPIMLMHVLLSLGFQRQGLSDAYQPEASLQAVRELEEALALSEGKTTWRKLRAMTLNNLGLAHHRLFTLENLSRTRWERAMDCYQQAVHLWREEADAFEEARSQQNIALLLARNGTEEGLWSALEILEKILVVRLRMPREAYETVTAIQRLMLLLEPMIPTPLLLMRMTPVIERCLERLWFVGLVGPALQLEYELIRFIVLGDVLTEGSVAPAILQRVADAGRRAEHAFEAASSLEGQLFLSATVGELHGIHALTEARSGAKGLDILVPATRAKARTLLLHRRVRFDERTPGSETQLMELSEQLQKAEEREELGGVAERISARSALAEAMSKKPEAYPDSVPPYPERLVARLRSHPETAFVDLTLTSAGCVCVTVLLGTDGRLKTRVQTLAIRSEEVATWLHRPTPKAPPGWLDLLADLGEVAVGERQDFERWLELAERCAAGMDGVLLQLWHRILGPVVDRLPAYGVRHLVFALSGPLAALPIAAASRMGADGRLRYLLEDFSSIRLTPSLDLWLEEDGVPMPVSPRLLVLMADPERTLPSPEKHVERIEALWEGKSASPLRLGTAFPMGQAATAEATLKGLAQADIAHLVCHGQHTMGDLEATGLRLEGDLLSASSLLKYPLPLRTRLAIVCACQSARTRTDDMGAEWMGVAGMLLRAGVREVVAALWDVHYQLSATLLECLHSGLVAGETPETALHAAMQVALEEGRRLGRTPEAAVEAPVLASLSPQHRTRMARLLPAPLFWAGFEVLAVGA